MKRGKLQCHSESRMVQGWYVKSIITEQPCVAQQVAQLTLNQKVAGSIPAAGTIWEYNLTAKVAGF